MTLLAGALSPSYYLREAGFEPYEWQSPVLFPSLKPKLLLTCRQAGKSTIIAGKVESTCRYEAGSDALIICPAQDQSKEVMHKLSDFVNMHDDPRLKADAVYEKTWVNSSRVMSLPGSERSVRGYSDPRFIVLDEGSRIKDVTYNATIPMTAGGVTEILALSTPYGKRGWFYRAWTSDSSVWDKIMVTVRWRLNAEETGLIEGPPEDEMKAMYAEQGIDFYYSPRHTKAFCEFSLSEIGAAWYRQEYQCEFVDLVTGLFTEALIEQSIQDTAEMLDFDDESLDEDAEVL